MTTIVIARGPAAWLLRRMGLAAITLPWKSIYVLPEFDGDGALIRHELVHLAQIERDGALKFSILYLYWLARYGYRKNPYEIEADHADR